MSTHPVNVTHLVFGLVFLGIAAAWALRATGLVDSGADRWILPAVLLLAGGAGLVAAVGKSLGGRPGAREEQPADPAYDPWDDPDGSGR